MSSNERRGKGPSAYLDYLRRLTEDNLNLTYAPRRDEPPVEYGISSPARPVSVDNANLLMTWPLHEMSLTPPPPATFTARVPLSIAGEENRDLHNEYITPQAVGDAMERWYQSKQWKKPVYMIKDDTMPLYEVTDLPTLYAHVYDFVYRLPDCDRGLVTENFLGKYPVILVLNALEDMSNAGVLITYHQRSPITGKGTQYWRIAKDLYGTT